MARRLAVTDLHGEGERLIQILAALHFRPHVDQLFLLGDYIDRGRNSRLTIELVMELVAGGAVALLGNHEELLLAAARSEFGLPMWLQNGGWTTYQEYGGLPPAQVLDFLRNLDEQPFHEEADVILVHAGILPGVPLEQQNRHDLRWIREPFHEDYRGKRVVFGHTPTKRLHGDSNQHQWWEPWFGIDKIGIDTGACCGGRVTVMDLDTLQTWYA